MAFSLRFLLLGAAFALPAIGLDTNARPDNPSNRTVRFEIDLTSDGHWEPYCGGLLVTARGPNATRKALTAAHCLYELGDPRSRSASLRAILSDGEVLPIDRAAIGKEFFKGGFAQREQAVTMDFAFIDLGPERAGTPTGIAGQLRPLAIPSGAKVTIFTPHGVKTCHAQNMCGAQFDVAACSAPMIYGDSGSPVWINYLGMNLVAGIMTDLDPVTRGGTATSYTSILAHSSFLVADPTVPDYDQSRSEFVHHYYGRPEYRLPRNPAAPNCRRSTESLVSVEPGAIGDQHNFAGAAFSPDGAVVSWDRTSGRLCTLRVGQDADCQPIPGPFGGSLVRGVNSLRNQTFLLRFGHGYAMLLDRDPQRNSWTVRARINAQFDLAMPSGGRPNLITNEVNGGFLTADNDLVLFGESALCVAKVDHCELVRFPDRIRGAATFTVRDAFAIDREHILAVGRDFPGNYSQCILYERRNGAWFAKKICQSVGKSYGAINAALPFRGGALAFSSSGGALFISNNLAINSVPINGLLGTVLGRPTELDDSVRAARWLVRDKYLAIVGSDGAFHILKVSPSGQPLSLQTDRCVWLKDLGLWLLALDIQGAHAAVTSQGGELYRLTLPSQARLDQFFDTASAEMGICS